jgi:hypothetical protein
MALTTEQQRKIDFIVLLALSHEPDQRLGFVDDVVRVYRDGIGALYPEKPAHVLDDARRRFAGLIAERLAQASADVGNA